MSDLDFQRLREKVELLTGERGGPNKPASGIRRGELDTRALHSSQVTAAPTMAEHNALQSDVAFLFNLLSKLSKG